MVAEQGVEQVAEQAEVLQDLIANAETMASSYRDNSIAEGALLGETVGPAGEQVRWRKQRSMVKAGAVPLPERFEAFDKFGKSSMLPTAQLTRMLSKPRADAPGERAFHTHRGEAACRICPPSSEAFTGTCEFCLERTAGAVRKHFSNASAQRAHLRAFHPDELEMLERELDRAERKADRETQARLAEAMLQMAQGQAAKPAEKGKGS